MVSNLYKADAFYKRQNQKKIASTYSPSQKLKKDKQGMYLLRKTPRGDVYKQRVKSDDYVYTRAETGVTKYSKGADKKKLYVRHKVESLKEHQKYAHKYDAETKTGKARAW